MSIGLLIDVLSVTSNSSFSLTYSSDSTSITIGLKYMGRVNCIGERLCMYENAEHKHGQVPTLGQAPIEGEKENHLSTFGNHLGKGCSSYAHVT